MLLSFPLTPRKKRDRKKRESIIAEQNSALRDSSRYLLLFLSFSETLISFFKIKNTTVIQVQIIRSLSNKFCLVYKWSLCIFEPKNYFDSSKCDILVILRPRQNKIVSVFAS